MSTKSSKPITSGPSFLRNKTLTRNRRPQSERIPTVTQTNITGTYSKEESDLLVTDLRFLRSNDLKVTDQGQRGLLESHSVPNLLIRPLTASFAQGIQLKDGRDKSPTTKPMPSRRRNWTRGPRRRADQAIGLPQSIKVIGENNNNVDLNQIDLQRCGLTSWPRTEDKSVAPKFISLQHNFLSSIDPPSPLVNLVVLDLYKNQITRLNGLCFIPNLRVLLLAKNRISSMEGISYVQKLEVLDLHGNAVSSTQGVSSLKKLKHLNLASNLLRHVADMDGLDALLELNLRRNHIRTVNDVHNLNSLEKIYLNFNEIYRYEDISSLQNCSNLTEISLKDNPIAKQPTYFHKASVFFGKIQRLDEHDVTEEDRRQSEELLKKLKEGNVSGIRNKSVKETERIRALSFWNTLKVNHKRYIKEKISEERNKFDLKEFIKMSQLSRSKSQSNFNSSKMPNEIKRNNTFPLLQNSDTTNSNSEPKLNNPKTKFQLSRSKSSLDIKLSTNDRSTRSSPRPRSGLVYNYNKTSVEQQMVSKNANSISISKTVTTQESLTVTPNESTYRKYPTRKFRRIQSESRLSVTQNTNKYNTQKEKNELQSILQQQKYALVEEPSSRVLTIAFSQIQNNLQHLNKHLEMYSNERSSESSEDDSSSESSTSIKENKPQPLTMDSREAEPATNFGLHTKEGPKFFAKMDNEVLRIYGNGRLIYPELLWDKCGTTNATTVLFEYIEYDDILEIFPCLRIRFPSVENFVFIETNICKIGQLNALSEIHHINSLTIKSSGNPVTKDPNWRLFVIFRLLHWGIHAINDTKISEIDRHRAMNIYSPLSQIAFLSLPQQQLNTLISSTPQNSNRSDDNNGDAKNASLKNQFKNAFNYSSFYLQELIGKEALQYKPRTKYSDEEKEAMTEANLCILRLCDWLFVSVARLSQFEKVWPSVFHDLVRDAVTDIRKPNYGKHCLDSLKKQLAWKKEGNS